jgi:hypothetical protein
VPRDLFVKRDTYAGALIILLGTVTVWKASYYEAGTLFHMGPGYFPMILGSVLLFLGNIILWTALRDSSAARLLLRPEWRGWICIIGGPILFIIIGTYGGLAPATFSCVFVSALGDRKSSLKSAFLLASGITAVGVVLFSYLLQVSFPLFRWGQP